MDRKQFTTLESAVPKRVSKNTSSKTYITSANVRYQPKVLRYIKPAPQATSHTRNVEMSEPIKYDNATVLLFTGVIVISFLTPVYLS